MDSGWGDVVVFNYLIVTEVMLYFILNTKQKMRGFLYQCNVEICCYGFCGGFQVRWLLYEMRILSI